MELLKDLPTLNDDVLLLIMRKMIELEISDLTKMRVIYNGWLYVTNLPRWPRDLSILQKIVHHKNVLYHKSQLDIGWIHDAKRLHNNHWHLASKFTTITMRRWCEGCGSDFYNRSFSPAQLEVFLLETWKCDSGCICEEFFSGLNWCVNCRYGTHDFFQFDDE